MKHLNTLKFKFDNASPTELTDLVDSLLINEVVSRAEIRYLLGIEDETPPTPAPAEKDETKPPDNIDLVQRSIDLRRVPLSPLEQDLPSHPSRLPPLVTWYQTQYPSGGHYGSQAN
jgi:hypothetical protein